MGVYKNNNGTLTPIANETQFIAPVNEYVTKPELEAIVPSDTSDENKLVNNDDVDTKLNDVWKAQEFLGVKNLLPYPYKNGEKSVTVQGITFTENEGVIHMSGTATGWAAYHIVYKKAVAPFKNGGAYRVYFADESIHSGINFQILGILADNSSDTLVNIADVQSHEMRITKDYVSYTIAIVVSPNTVLDDNVVHPMIQFLADENMFWEKPVKTNTELTNKLNSITDIWDIQGEMGAKNILPIPYTAQSGIDTNGITLTYDSDGAITLNGTSTNYAVFNLFLGTKLFEENRKYTCYFKEEYSSLPSGVGVQIWSLNSDNSTKTNYAILNNTLLKPRVFTYADSEDTLCTVRVVINPNVTLSNMKLHVMLQHAEDPYNVWTPYAKTNKKLTDDIERIDNIINDIPAQNVASITCWGDSLTAMGGWTQKLATLSGLPVYNGGTGGENSKGIMARQGGDVMIVDNITIPATTTSVTIASRASDNGISTQLGNKVMPLLQGGTHVNPVMLGDIAGTLAWTGSDYADQNGTWTFTRATAGEEIVINRPTAIRTNFDINHNGKNELMIIFMGQNGGWNDSADLIHQHKLMIDHFKGKEYVILGLSSGTATSRADYEAAMKEAFGRRFISLREYLAHPIYENGEIVSCYGLADQNLTPTTDDLEKIAIGQVPASCLADSVHYTVGTREVIGNMLYKKLCELNIL